MSSAPYSVTAIVRRGVCEVDITTMYIYNDASLHLTEIVDDLSDMCIGVQIVIVIETVSVCACEISVTGSVHICSDISVDPSDVTMTEAVSEVAMSVSEIMTDIMSEISVAVAEIVSDRTVVPDIHIVPVPEIVTMSAHIVAVQIACCMRRCSDQQENKLEDQKNGEDDRDAREDLLRQI